MAFVVTLVVKFIGDKGEPVVALSLACWQSSHLSNEMYSRKKEKLGNTSSSPRASVISIPELFTYALYFVIAFVLEVLYLAITLLLVLLSISCWCT